MAQYYDLAGSYQTVKVESQTSAPDVEAIGIYTKPSGVYTTVLVPLAAYKAGNYASYLEPPALLIEQLMGNDLGGPDNSPGGPLVTGAAQAQETDSSGLLAFFMDFTVTYQAVTGTAGTYSGIVRIPSTSLASFDAFTVPIPGGTPSDLIIAEYNRLKKLAAS